MILYKFMNKDLFNEGKDISEYMKDEYGLTLPNKLFDDDNIVFLYDYLKEKVDEHNCKKIDIDTDGFLFEKETEKELIERVIKKIYKIVSEPKNYLADLYSAIYMGILYNMKGEDSFAYKEDETILEGEKEEQHQLRKKEIYKKASYKEEINSVWVTTDDKINRAVVQKNILFQSK